MMKDFAMLIPFTIVLLAVGLTIWAAVIQSRRTVTNLQKLAEQLGLVFVPASKWLGRPQVAGRLRGKQINFFNYTTGSGKSSTTWSAMKVAVTSPLTFTLKKQGFGTKLAEFFGAHEITVGDAEFDQAWFVQTNQPEFLRAALIPELRAKLMTALRSGMTGAFELKVGEVKYVEVGTFADRRRAERLSSFAEVLCDLADVAEVAAEGQT